MRPLRVCVDARRLVGFAGGIDQVVIGLAHGFSHLDDGTEEYFFLTSSHDTEWIRPYLRGSCHLLPSRTSLAPSRWRRVLSRLPGARKAWEALQGSLGARGVTLPVSDGTVEGAGIDVLHFPRQTAFLTSVPSAYQPHDLQHLHLPANFTLGERAWREVAYRSYCRQARAVVMMTQWGRRDIIRAYSLPQAKVWVAPGASVLAAYPCPSSAEIERLRLGMGLPASFAFFPAQTYPHKNHIGLLDALALIRDEHGVEIPLVATGYQNRHFRQIREHAAALRLEAQLHFLGYVAPITMRALYKLARCLVFPSRFEGWGLPVIEAFDEGVPVTCSNSTSLPEVAAGAALLFDPDDRAEMAHHILRLWGDEALRKDLIAKGAQRASELSWTKTARTLRAIYRDIAGRRTPSDLVLLEASGAG